MPNNELLIPNRRYPRLTDADVERLPGTVNFDYCWWDMGAWELPFIIEIGDDDSEEDEADSWDFDGYECLHCHGTGQDWGSLMPCPECDGEGYEWWLR